MDRAEFLKIFGVGIAATAVLPGISFGDEPKTKVSPEPEDMWEYGIVTSSGIRPLNGGKVEEIPISLGGEILEGDVIRWPKDSLLPRDAQRLFSAKKTDHD